jgi:hypothetical protein
VNNLVRGHAVNSALPEGLGTKTRHSASQPLRSSPEHLVATHQFDADTEACSLSPTLGCVGRRSLRATCYACSM